MNINAQQAMLAYLATLLAIVVMTIAAAIICLTVDAEKHFAQIVAALGFIGAAVTGLIGVIGTFRPKGQPAATTQSGDVNMRDKPMMNPYAILGAALGGLLLLIGAYFYGRSDGKAIEQGAQARVEAAVAKERAKNEAAVDDGNVAGQSAETARSSNTREIYRETERFIDRPVYGVGCIDTDGVRILERAAAISNGEDPEQSAGGTKGDSPRPQTLPDGTQNGRLALATQLDLYDVAGEFRLWIVRLQCAVLASRGEALRADCPRANLEK